MSLNPAENPAADPSPQTDETPSGEPSQFPASDPSDVMEVLNLTGDRLIGDLHHAEPEYVEKLRRENAEETGAAPENPNRPKAGETLIDKKGFVFDPEICKTNPDGSPELSKTGCFVVKNHRRKSDLKKASKRQEKQGRVVIPPSREEQREAYHAEAAAADAEAAAWQAAEQERLQTAATLAAGLVWTRTKLWEEPATDEEIAELVRNVKIGVDHLPEGIALPWYVEMSFGIGAFMIAPALKPEKKERREKIGLFLKGLKMKTRSGLSRLFRRKSGGE